MTTVEKITVWLAHGDGGERGIGPVIAYCSTQAQAEGAAKGIGWYGGNGYVEDAPALRIDGAVYLLRERDPIDMDAKQAQRDADLRAKTLAALTEEQKRVLGIRA
jgi:hypothetical protein